MAVLFSFDFGQVEEMCHAGKAEQNNLWWAAQTYSGLTHTGFMHVMCKTLFHHFGAVSELK